MLTEAEIQRQCFDFLVLQGFLVLRVNSGRMGRVPFVRWQALGTDIQTTGASDLLAIAPGGRTYAIECKAPGEAARPNQSQFLAEARQRGAVAVVVDNVDSLVEVILKTMR